MDINISAINHYFVSYDCNNFYIGAIVWTQKQPYQCTKIVVIDIIDVWFEKGIHTKTKFMYTLFVSNDKIYMLTQLHGLQ